MSSIAKSIAAKARYVRKASQTRGHTCHWPGCLAQVPPAMWGCRKHWFKLPKALRDKVWAAYRPGQEERLDPSQEYLAVADEVQEWIAGYYGIKGTTTLTPHTGYVHLHDGEKEGEASGE